VTKGGVMVENPLLKEVADKLDTWMDNWWREKIILD
jgi:hypothetical protein